MFGRSHVHVQKRGFTKLSVLLKQVSLLSILGRDRGLVNNCSAAVGRAPNWTGRALNSSYFGGRKRPFSGLKRTSGEFGFQSPKPAKMPIKQGNVTRPQRASSQRSSSNSAKKCYKTGTKMCCPLATWTSRAVCQDLEQVSQVLSDAFLPWTSSHAVCGAVTHVHNAFDPIASSHEYHDLTLLLRGRCGLGLLENKKTKLCPSS